MTKANKYLRPKAKLGPCRRCSKVANLQTRGLCWACYHTPGIREQYPSLSKFGQVSVAATILGPRRLPTPTRARPGTPEKIAVLAARVAAGEYLFHPDDGDFETPKLQDDSSHDNG